MSRDELDGHRTRWVKLGKQRVALLGRLPQAGDVLTPDFFIPEARRASLPLLAADLRQGACDRLDASQYSEAGHLTIAEHGTGFRTGDS